MASIIIVSGPNEGDYYPLGTRTLVVGRDEACPVQIVDELISRKHLQIRSEGTGHVAADMNSANGIFVNGRRISAEVLLQDGDSIDLGKSRLTYYTDDFNDRESAFAHFKSRGQKSKNTVEL